LSSVITKIWNALAIISCVWAFVLVVAGGDAASAFTSALAGCAFYFLGNYVRHDDLD